MEYGQYTIIVNIDWYDKSKSTFESSKDFISRLRVGLVMGKVRRCQCLQEPSGKLIRLLLNVLSTVD